MFNQSPKGDKKYNRAERILKEVIAENCPNLATQIWQHKPTVSKNWTNSRYDKLNEINKKIHHNKTSETNLENSDIETIHYLHGKTIQISRIFMRNQKEMAHFYFKMKTTVNSEPYIQQKYATGMKGKPIFSYEGKTKKIFCQ